MGAVEMSSDSVDILHNEFADFTAATFQLLYSNNNFADVTLVCEDGRQLKAHKIILSSSSVLFRRILVGNPHQYPVIYLRGIKYQDLQLIVQFIYLGQIKISQEDLQDFIDVSTDLEITGIADVKQNNVTEVLEVESENIEIKHSFNLETINHKSDDKCEECDEIFTGKNKLKKHIRTIHEGLRYPLSNADRSKLCRDRRNSIIPKEDMR